MPTVTRSSGRRLVQGVGCILSRTRVAADPRQARREISGRPMEGVPDTPTHALNEALMLDAIIGTLVHEIREEYKAASVPLPLLKAKRRLQREAKVKNKACR